MCIKTCVSRDFYLNAKYHKCNTRWATEHVYYIRKQTYGADYVMQVLKTKVLFYKL